MRITAREGFQGLHALATRPRSSTFIVALMAVSFPLHNYLVHVSHGVNGPVHEHGGGDKLRAGVIPPGSQVISIST
jgi:hypothetical protein